MKSPGITIAVALGWLGFDIALDRRHFMVQLGVIGITITFFNFWYRYNMMIGAFIDLARGMGVKPVDYLDAYIQRQEEIRRSKK
jgi:hypothetical protein